MRRDSSRRRLKDYLNNVMVKINPKILREQKLRTAIASRDFTAFIKIYFSNHITDALAVFHKRWIKLVSDLSVSSLVVSAFRSSGKSTIISHLYPLWSIVGVQKVRNILIVTYNMQKAEHILKNIKREMEDNSLFKKDLGPFKESRGPWNSYVLYVPKYNAWIEILSTDQSPRGLRHDERRPDLIICDDMESLESVKTKESRDKLYEWYKSELVPAGSDNARYIVIGTPLHPDSLFSRLKKEIDLGDMYGTVDMTPILDSDNIPTWGEKYKSKDDIDDFRTRKGIPEVTWLVEYMLETMADDSQIIRPEHIHYYESDEKRGGYYIETIISVDPAATANPTSDYSGIVVLSVWQEENIRRIYVDEVHNLRFEHQDLVTHIASLVKNSKYENVKVYIENVGFQATLVTLLGKEGISAQTFPVKGKDKRTRLIECSVTIANGTVVFPKAKAQILIDEILGFGIDRYDDLVDALTQGILVIAEAPTNGMLELARQDMAKMHDKTKSDPRSPGSLASWVIASQGGL